MKISGNTHFQNSLSQLRLCNDFLDESSHPDELYKDLPAIEIVAMHKLYVSCKDFMKNYERLIKDE